jgi:two-component system nitrogen regulation sensor histidine kinase NtrY
VASTAGSRRAVAEPVNGLPTAPSPWRRPLSWRAVAICYLAAAHLVFAVLLVAAFLDRPEWLLATEALLAVSFAVGLATVRRGGQAQELLGTAVELLHERDFGSHLVPVGQPEADALVGLFNRLSDRLRAERLRLEEQSFLLDKVLAASPVGVLTLDHDGRVALLNAAAAELLELPLESAPGRTLREHAVAAKNAAAGSSPRDSLAAELATLTPGESRLVPLSGGRRLRCYRGEFFDRGFPRGFFLLAELTAELHASEKAAYEQLVRLISHEVSNSVAAVASLLESCLAYGPQLAAGDREDHAQALTVAATRMRSLNTFVAGFAEVVRLPPPDRRPCDLAALLDDVLVLLGPELARRRITARWRLREPLPEQPVDRNQLEQVLLNALRNAAEAIGEDGTIELSWAREEGRPTLRVADSGAGIAPEAVPRLFVPFFSTKPDGRGLGLVLIREVAGAHGIGVGLGNRAEGGAELVLRF